MEREMREMRTKRDCQRRMKKIPLRVFVLIFFSVHSGIYASIQISENGGDSIQNHQKIDQIS